MSAKRWNRILFAVWLVVMVIALAFVASGCSGGKATITDYDMAGNMLRRVVIDPYVLGRDVVNKGGEMWVEVAPDGSILYWLVMGEHESRVSPENAKMIKEAIDAFNPLGGIVK